MLLILKPFIVVSVKKASFKVKIVKLFKSKNENLIV